MNWNCLMLSFMTLFAAVNVPFTDSYQILGLFPHQGISHFYFFHPLMRELAKRGHELSVVSYFPDKDPPANYTDIPLIGSALTGQYSVDAFQKGPLYTHLTEFFLVHDLGISACEAFLDSDALKKVLNPSKPYDLVIAEQFNSDCVTGVAHFIKAPLIGLSSSALLPWHYKRMGTPSTPSHVPVIFLGHSEEMRFFERVKNFFSYHLDNFLYDYLTQPKTNELLRKRFGNSVPDVRKIVSNYDLLLVNQHYSMSGVKPLSPAVIEVGGLHIQEPKLLDKNLKQILDSAQHGVIYICWGSLLRSESLSTEKREAILNVVRRLKQRVVWKWENDSIPNRPANVFIREWMPQREILCHPNVKVFMTHGGLMGSSEAAYCGVPTVVTPFLGDQFLNAAAMKYRGMAAILPFEEITEDSVHNALQFALSSTAQKNAKIVSKSFRDRPETPMDTAVWWVNHVIETKGSPLTRSASIHLPWYIEYSFDVLAFFGIILVGVYLFFKLLLRLICTKKKDSKKQKTK